MPTVSLAGYTRISVDEELDRDNTSIENQKLIITDYVAAHFPGAKLTFFEDRDRSGYTFEQREGYQKMRKGLMSGDYDILIVKDFSRFARRNSKGLVELEDLRDAGVRIISIGDAIDYPTYDDWMSIQFRFLINEMPVTDASKKVKSVISNRQNIGRWICAVPYGYVITNTKKMTFEIDEPSAEVVREIFELYKQGWGYKKIAGHLTEKHIPTPRTVFKNRKEEAGEECRYNTKNKWSIQSVSGILTNDFYIGTLRQHKYKRRKINGSDVELDKSEHIVFENNHPPIVDYRTFATVQEQIKLRAKEHYRGVKKYPNVYSGFLVCGDCGSPMFSMSRPDLAPAYVCGEYHTRGKKGCTSHHVRVDFLDSLLKRYLQRVRDNASDMFERLTVIAKGEASDIQGNTDTAEMLRGQIEKANEEVREYVRQKARDTIKNPDQAKIVADAYDQLIEETSNYILGLQNQLELVANKRNAVIEANRTAMTAIEVFDRILNKESLDREDLSLLVEKIYVYEDHIDVQLKADIDALLGLDGKEGVVNFNGGAVKPVTLTLKTKNQKDKVYSVRVISDGDPLEIFTDRDELMLKKYSPIATLEKFSEGTTKSLNDLSGYLAVICDTDEVLYAAGEGRKEFAKKHISDELGRIMRDRRSYIANLAEGGDIVPLTEDAAADVTAQIIVPIVAGGDCLGAVSLVSMQEGAKMETGAVKLCRLTADILANQFD